MEFTVCSTYSWCALNNLGVFLPSFYVLISDHVYFDLISDERGMNHDDLCADWNCICEIIRKIAGFVFNCS